MTSMTRLIAICSFALLITVSIVDAPYADPRPATQPPSEEVMREMRAIANKEVRSEYPILLEELSLSADQSEALILWLIQENLDRRWIATAPWKEARPGRVLSPAERLTQVEKIIGPAKAQRLLELERNLHVYDEAQKIANLLQGKGMPVSKVQQDKLVDMLMAVEEQLPDQAPPPSSAEISVEYVESTIARLNERERLVLELAPGMLSPDQVKYLFDQYEYRKQSRMNSIAMQKKRRDENPHSDIPWHYPSF